MENEKLYLGYDAEFLINDEIKEIVDLPIIGKKHVDDIAPIEGNDESILKYLNFSVKMSASRKFAFYTASNIDGNMFKKAHRRGWRKDPRAKEFQWGTELYSAKKSDFDKGHMTKREDVQWGKTIGLAQKGADSTFFYPNSVPQHKDLNQVIWKSLEDYVLHTETKTNLLKVCVFTGPVLSESDPNFVTQVKGATVQIPIVFWKVIVYPKNDGKLYRVGFMMSQNRLLFENGIVEEYEKGVIGEDLFMQFEDAETYQVNISLIETLAGIKFPKAIDSYKDDRSKKLVLKEIDIDPDLESFSNVENLGFSIDNLTL
ncbi:MAG: DNA/RNA non-specific endonuclease [Parachlamydiaceae bacterium]|nr:DNA/RNA non-specific endonuclease [Parachlamydiaceae bacterium]